ncbi:MAG: hypothetical protein D4Q79_01330 [Spirochaetia bacterium]|nr:MAG: hypothetical protein D4Q79_01330 [Spirochaetia bacterium]
MGRVSGNLVSEIKLGKLVETLRILQEFGAVDEDFRRLRKDHDLALEIFRIIRDNTIFRNTRYAMGYERDEQIEKFTKWNTELSLGIPEADFANIPKEFPNPPSCSMHDLHCTCLVYEFEEPLETLLNGMRILDHELRKINGSLSFEQSIGGVYNSEKLELFFPERLPPDKIRFRPEAYARKKGFRFIVAQLGRGMRFPQAISANKGWGYFKDFFQWCDEKQIRNVGQELPYVAAMYPGWITSVCGDSSLYPRPLALDIQADSIFKDFRPDHCSCLCLHEYLNSNYPSYGKTGKSKPFRIEATDFDYRYKGDSVVGSGYGICTITQET